MWVIFFLLTGKNVLADEILYVKVDKVIDGDTIKFIMPNMPKNLERMYVRLIGIDTPEIHSKCDQEHIKALESKEYLKHMIEGKMVNLEQCSWDKFGSRIDCIVSMDGVNINQQVLDNGYGIKYNGDRKTHNWCK